MTRRGFRFTAIVVASLAILAAARFVGRASTATIPSTAYAAMHWRNIGPFRGGRALAVAGVPGDPNRFYFGAVGGGVWTTANAGATWTPIFDREPAASIGAIAVAPSDPRTIYVGTGEADMRSDIIHGNGMYRSTDAGATWMHVGLEATRQIGRIVVDPTDARIVYVAALGHAYAANPERGVYKSTDGGATWRHVLLRDADTGAIDLALDPHDSRTLFASLWQTRRPPWNVYPPSDGPGSGLYVSHDAGVSWSFVRGLPSAGLGKIGVAFAPSRPSRLFAVVDATAGGIFRSDDRGATWKRVDGDTRLWKRGWYFCHVAVDPRDPDRVYVSNTSVYRSEDGGASFAAIKGAPGGDDYHMLWIDPTAPARMILASDQGATVSVDGARTWSTWYNQPTAQLYHVATDDAFPYRVFGAQQDSGAVEIASRTGARGISTRDWHPLDVGGESDSIAPDPLHPDLVYGGRVDRENLVTRELQHVSPTLGREETFRDVWTLPLVFSAADPHALYFSHQQIFATHDGGASWRVMSPDLTRATSDGPRRGVVYALAPSPLDARQVWAGTDDGLVKLTRDDGAHWSDVTPPQLGPWSKIATIEASHSEPGTAYVAVDRHRLDDDAPYAYRTRDFGATWTPVVAGLPPGAFVNALREDPTRPGLLYAATETGVAVSFDDGDAWQSLQLDLPTCSVRDVTVRRDDLVIATHGRSFWILDDLEPLRQAAFARAGAPYLVKPPVAYRTRSGDDEGTPLPPETPRGENPVAGVPIDYVLAPGHHGRVIVEVRDGAGALARRFSSDDASPAVDPATLEFPSYWIARATPIATAPGHHRIAWNLRYAPLEPGQSDPTSDAVTDGAWAAPGTYTVRLIVDDAMTAQPLEVRRDPRTVASDAELREQFAIAREVETLRARVDAAYRAALAAKPRASGTTAARLATIAGFPPPDDPRDSVPEPATDFTSLHALRGRLEGLDDALESADAAPTPDQRAAYARERDAASRALLDWDSLRSQLAHRSSASR